MTGMPCQAKETASAATMCAFLAASKAACSIARPDWRPRFMHAEHTPDTTATIMPFLKLNSATAFFFSSSGSSVSFSLPA